MLCLVRYYLSAEVVQGMEVIDHFVPGNIYLDVLGPVKQDIF